MLAPLTQCWKKADYFIESNGKRLGILIGTHLHVFFDGEGGKDIVVLWNKAHTTSHELVGSKVGDVFIAKGDRTGVNVNQPKKGLQEGGLTRTIGSDNAHQFTFMGVKIGFVEDVDAWKVSGHEFVGPNERPDSLSRMYLFRGCWGGF